MFISCVMVAAVLGCMQSTDLPKVNGAQKPVRVGVAVYGLSGDFMQNWLLCLQQHPGVKNGDVIITVLDAKFDEQTQVEQMHQLVTEKSDAIIFVPLDAKIGARAAQSALNAGIPVIASNTRVDGDQVVVYVGNNDVVAGELQTQSVVDRMEGHGNLVVVEGPIGQSAQMDRRQGMENILKMYPDIKVLDSKSCNWSRTQSKEIVSEWLTRFPGQINGIIGQNDSLGLGSIDAIRAAELDVRQFAISGVDGTRDGLVAVKAGDMVSVFQDAKAQAQGALDVAIRAVRGDSYNRNPISGEIMVTHYHGAVEPQCCMRFPGR